jgi:hypothetical protein
MRDIYGIYVLMSSEFNALKGESYQSYLFSGRPQAIRLAEYGYWFLYNHIQMQWQNYKREHKIKGVVARNAYFQGVVDGFARKLRATRAQARAKESSTPESSRLLALTDQSHEAELEDYIESRYAGAISNSRSYRRNYTEESGYGHGWQEGQKLTLSQGIQKTGSDSVLSLGPTQN